MDVTALFKITYGLFMAGVEFEGEKNGCIINTAMQVTAEPPKMCVGMLKTNYTADLILKKKSLSLSILSRECPMEVFQNFGFQSGRNTNKFESIDFEKDVLGNPVLKEFTNAVVALNVTEVKDLDTHWLFLCDVEDASNTKDTLSMSYTDYRVLKSGGSLTKNITKTPDKKYVCSLCHYEYDGEIPFDKLPDSYVCPVCGAPKSAFQLQ